MTYIAILLLTCFMEMLISYAFFSQVAERKVTNIKCVVVGILLFGSGVLVNLLLSNTVWINTLYFLIINLLFGFICYKIQFTRLFFYSILLDIFSTALEFATIFLVSAVTGTDTKAYLDQTNMLILELVISKLLYFLTCNILARFVKKEKSYVKFPTILYIYPLIITAELLVFWDICVNSDINLRQRISLAVISSALFFSVVLLFILYQHNIEKENELYELKTIRHQEEQDKKYFEFIEQSNNDMRAFSHDIKNHLTQMRNFESIEDIQHYIDGIYPDVEKFDSVGISKNKMLDLIISKYIVACKNKGIKFDYEVKTADLDYIDDTELSIILNNILDNAVEAAVKSQEKQIELSLKHINNMDLLSVVNSCDAPPKHNNRRLITTKFNTDSHGFGTKIIEKHAKKNNGKYEWFYDENEHRFHLTILFQRNNTN